MNSLERQYRVAVRWYPSQWRASNEEVVVGTLLDVAEGEGRNQARIRELANLAAHGLSTRMRMLPAAVPSTVRDRTSTAALAVGSAISLTALMQLESNPSRHVLAFVPEAVSFGPFASPAVLVYVAWLVALMVSLAGFTATGRWLAVATIPLAIGSRVLADASGMLLRPTWTFYGLLIMLAVLVLAGRPVPDRSGVGWLLIWFLPATGVFLLPQFTSHTTFQDPLWVDVPTFISWSPLIAVGMAVVLRILRQPAWAVTVLLLGLPFTGVALSAMGGRAFQEVSEIAALVATAFVGGVIVLRLLGLRIRVHRESPRS